MQASVAVGYGLSSCSSQAPEHRLSSCGTEVWLLGSMWDLPGPGIEPVSPVLVGGFFTTEPPGKPGRQSLNHWTPREVPGLAI